MQSKDRIRQNNPKDEVVLQRLLSSRQAFFQITDGDKKILISRGNDLCHGNIEPRLLPELLLRPLSSIEFKELNSVDELVSEYGASVIDLHPILWDTIIQYSNGELNSAIQDNSVIKLSKWPNYKSIKQNSTFMKLSVIMCKRWTTLQRLINETGFSYVEVINFINVCYELGYLIIDNTRQLEADSSLNQPKAESKKRSLFGMIRKRLGIR